MRREEKIRWRARRQEWTWTWSTAKRNKLQVRGVARPEEMKFEYEMVRLHNEPHVVSNTKGWHWISSIQGELLVDAFTIVVHETRSLFKVRVRQQKME